MPRQPEIHYRLKPLDKNGRQLIYLDFAYNKQRLRYSFGQFVDPKDWNDKKELVKNKQATTDDGKFKLNDLLESLKKVCSKTYNESLKNGIPEPEVLRTAMDAFINQNHNDVSKPTLYSLADRFVSGEIKNKGKEKSQSSLDNYAAVLKHLKEFEVVKKYRIDFDTITLDFFYSYITFLRSKNLAVNTIAKDISILKVFMGEAVDMEYTDNLKFRHKKFSFNEEETDQIYLKEEELHQLYRFDLSKNKKLEQVRDLFIFGAWVGLRISDYSNIKRENIKQIDGDYFIDMTTQKTKDQVIIPCNPVVLEIFEKYSHNPNKLPKAISDQKFNEYIKEACKLAGEDDINPVKSMIEKGRLNSKPELMLWQCVSSHTCRRSFATNYYLQGFPTIDLMKVTTHKTERSFLKYIRVSKLDTAKRMAAHIKENWSKKLLRVA